MYRKKKLIIILFMFVLLSGIKFFTAKVGLLADPTVQLVVKSNPTISNSFMMMGEETNENKERYKGTWYYEKKYKIIVADEMGFPGESLYDFFIATWWISCVGIPIYMLFFGIKLIRNKKVS